MLMYERLTRVKPSWPSRALLSRPDEEDRGQSRIRRSHRGKHCGDGRRGRDCDEAGVLAMGMGVHGSGVGETNYRGKCELITFAHGNYVIARWKK
jgi:hypothetical protein